ncbi:hypothetical protein BQ8482_340016 [Mesorhizobium delmotii]|uniref:Uncharacterized protein n=1 Tax=Mesorhizobium delmotii TaxID=1631247 RepID=A0A2P9APN2_9HYPH|nr:hypothetical protein BQ8482_340016 [Mesorhizobium delmotii]
MMTKAPSSPASAPLPHLRVWQGVAPVATGLPHHHPFRGVGVWRGKVAGAISGEAKHSHTIAGGAVGIDLRHAFPGLAHAPLLGPYAVAQRDTNDGAAVLVQQPIRAFERGLSLFDAQSGLSPFQVKKIKHCSAFEVAAVPSMDQPLQIALVPATYWPLTPIKGGRVDNPKSKRAPEPLWAYAQNFFFPI